MDKMNQPDRQVALGAARSAVEGTSKVCLIVAGMHRSGTSAVTGVLSRLGAKLPDTEMPGDAHNPKGYGESQKIYEFNERLLESAGSAWTDLGPFNKGWLSSPIANPFAQELRSLVEAEFGHAPLIVLKDPRICRILPFWLAEMTRMHFLPRVVISIRNPLEVAASLHQRDGLTTTLACLLWLRHVLDAELESRSLPRSFVLYKDLIQDWRSVIERVGHELDISWPKRSSAADCEIDQFLSADFRRHHSDRQDVLSRGDVPDWVKEVYGLVSGSTGPQANARPRLDEIRGEFDKACSRFGTLVYEAGKKRELENRLHGMSMELEARGEAFAASQSELEARKSEVEARGRQAARREMEITTDFRKQVAQLRAQLSERDTEIRDYLEQVAHLRVQLSELHNSTSWRVSAPLRMVSRGAQRILIGRQNAPDKPETGQDPFTVTAPGIDKTLPTKNQALETTYSNHWRLANTAKNAAVYGELTDRRARAELCDVKLIAYYLPQFHPIPENDIWWGRGFTEWRNVSKAVPVFADHYQPKLPGELGFYDLRNVDVMRRQVELAQIYGISAFCFHFYWFGGKTLLETPVLNYLNDPSLDLPFCLCWANENWTRRWDGAENEMLLGQSHSPDDDIAFLRYVKKYFDDPRYLKIDGRPILTVYRPSTLPDPRATAERWRAEANAMGLPGLYLVATNSFGFEDAEGIGFDALSEFPPHGRESYALDETRLTAEYDGNIFSYEACLPAEAETVDSGIRWPGVMPAWDNTARRPRHGNVFHGSTPEIFRKWLDLAIGQARNNPPNQRMVVINAWNEWAEGAYLEPDRLHGYSYLAACGSAIEDHLFESEDVSALLADTRTTFRARHAFACVLHLFYEDLAEEFAQHCDAFGAMDMYITVSKAISLESVQHIMRLFPGAYIQEVPNRGRDMAPFLSIWDKLKEGNHKFVCKLHTKRSPHLPDGNLWREQLLESLLSDEMRRTLEIADEILPKAGIFVPPGALLSLAIDDVRANSVSKMEKMADKAGLDLQFNEPFVAGSMFWFRPEALSVFATLASPEDFEPELGQIDGTLAHALERMTVIAVRSAGFDVAEIQDAAVVAQVYH